MLDLNSLLKQSQQWAKQLGFADMGVSDCDLGDYQANYQRWLEKGYHGEMQWLEDQLKLKFDPQSLHPGTSRILSLRMHYFPPNTEHIQALKNPETAYISRYALGRDYHKLIRKRLAKLAKQIEQFALAHGYTDEADQRPFVDSAPVLERPIAEKAGIAWIGKHTLALTEQDGSWFFLGELFTNIPFPQNQHTVTNKCGDCEACLKVCPTQAFPQPYELDARRCISYLTIEFDGVIPEEFREPIGNRVFGCDDCQAICPWNKFAQHSEEADFSPRHNLDKSSLIELFEWSEEEFLQRCAGSPIRRTGYRNWQRNLSIGLGNAPSDIRIIEALKKRLPEADEVLRPHIEWAIEKQYQPARKRVRKLRSKS
jgi:epoxyqueuosine reductase